MDGLGPELEPHLAEPSLNKLRKVRARLGEMKEGLGPREGAGARSADVFAAG